MQLHNVAGSLHLPRFELPPPLTRPHPMSAIPVYLCWRFSQIMMFPFLLKDKNIPTDGPIITCIYPGVYCTIICLCKTSCFDLIKKMFQPTSNTLSGTWIQKVWTDICQMWASGMSLDRESWLAELDQRTCLHPRWLYDWQVNCVESMVSYYV